MGNTYAYAAEHRDQVRRLVYLDEPVPGFGMALAIDDSETTQQLVKEKSYKLIERVFKHIDAHLSGKNHIVGNRRTIADAYAFAMIRWGNALPNGLADYPNLSQFYQNLYEDKGVQRAMAQQGIKS